MARKKSKTPSTSPSKPSSPSSSSLFSRPFDLFLVICFFLFSITSLVFEMYITFEVPLSPTSPDPINRCWYWYASSFDPIFLSPPLFLWFMCSIDGFVFGPFYLYLIYCFVKRDNGVRGPGLLFVGAIVYSTVVYFGIEVIGERERADMLWVFIINIPYTIVPLLLGWRIWKEKPFG